MKFLIKSKNFLNLKNQINENLVSSNPLFRKILLILFDAILICVCLFSYFHLNGHFSILKSNFDPNYFSLIFTITLISIITYLLTGQYRWLTKYTQSGMIYKLALINIFVLSLSQLIFFLSFSFLLSSGNLFSIGF